MLPLAMHLFAAWRFPDANKGKRDIESRILERSTLRSVTHAILMVLLVAFFAAFLVSFSQLQTEFLAGGKGLEEGGGTPYDDPEEKAARPYVNRDVNQELRRDQDGAPQSNDGGDSQGNDGNGPENPGGRNHDGHHDGRNSSDMDEGSESLSGGDSEDD